MPTRCARACALAIGIIYLLAGFGRTFIPSSLGWRALFVISVMLWTIFALQDSVLTGLRATRWVPVENILFALAKLALLPLALALTVHQGLFVAWTVPVLVATAAVNWYLFRKRIPEHEAMNAAIDDLPSGREIASLAVAQYAQALINFFTPSIVVLIVITRLGPVAEARYYVPTLIAGGVAGFLWNLNTSFLVEGSREPGALRQHANVTIRAALVVLLPTVIIGDRVRPGDPADLRERLRRPRDDVVTPAVVVPPGHRGDRLLLHVRLAGQTDLAPGPA